MASDWLLTSKHGFWLDLQIVTDSIMSSLQSTFESLLWSSDYKVILFQILKWLLVFFYSCEDFQKLKIQEDAQMSWWFKSSLRPLRLVCLLWNFRYECKYLFQNWKCQQTCINESQSYFNMLFYFRQNCHHGIPSLPPESDDLSQDVHNAN